MRDKQLSQVKAVVLPHVHMHLVYQPLDELVRVMVLIIVKLRIARSYPSYEPLMGDYSARAFSLIHVFEKICQFVDEIVLFFVEWLPREYMAPEGLTVVQRLDRAVNVANVRVLHTLKDVTYVFKAQMVLVVGELGLVLLYGDARFDRLLLFYFALTHATSAEVAVLLLLPAEVRNGLTALTGDCHVNGACYPGVAAEEASGPASKHPLAFVVLISIFDIYWPWRLGITCTHYKIIAFNY